MRLPSAPQSSDGFSLGLLCIPPGLTLLAVERRITPVRCLVQTAPHQDRPKGIRIIWRTDASRSARDGPSRGREGQSSAGAHGCSRNWSERVTHEKFRGRTTLQRFAIIGGDTFCGSAIVSAVLAL